MPVRYPLFLMLALLAALIGCGPGLPDAGLIGDAGDGDGDIGDGDGDVGDGDGDEELDGGEADAGSLMDGGAVHGDAGAPFVGDGDGDGDGLLGWIGSACDDDDDCPFVGGTCLTGPDIPGGMCTQACDQFCPDADGFPVTFCVDDSALGDEAAALGTGACHSRCDYGAYPGTGCRDGYGCVDVPRANEPGTVVGSCLPGVEPDPVSACQQTLIDLGVDFEPTSIPDTSPSTHPNLTCHVEDPVVLHPPLNGVDLLYFDGSPTPNIRGSCEMVLALARTTEDAAARGVSGIRHIGTYVCRVISGTDTLSRHAYGDAIDIWGFDMDDGSQLVLEDDWIHDTNMFDDNMAAQFLWDISLGWHEAEPPIWNIVLTPNYNLAHDNHYHVDMTPLSHFRGSLGGGYFGENPHPGE